MRATLTGLAVAALILGTAAPAAAQSPTCRHIAAELQALGRGGAPLQQAGQLRRQYDGIIRAMGQLGCDSGGLFSQPPAQCQALRAQAGSLAGQINQIEAGGRQSGSDVRRRQLEDAYAANECPGSGRIENVRAIYDNEARPRYATPTAPDPKPAEEAAMAEPAATTDKRGGQVPICVRSCDGFFFPVNYSGAEGQYSDVCRASCPGATAEMFWMPQNGDLAQAVSARGQSYTAIPAAFKFRQTHDPACSCKSQGESWGRALQQAEGLIRHKGDIVVTAETSARLANPDAQQHKALRGLKTADPVTTGAVRGETKSELERRLTDDARDTLQPLPTRR